VAVAVVLAYLVKAVTARATRVQDVRVKAVQAVVAAATLLLEHVLAHTLVGLAGLLVGLAVLAGSAFSAAVAQLFTNQAELAQSVLCVLSGPDARVHSHQLV
jgi:hypothetical protein